ncbi:MAG: PIN domain-containing protein [Bacillota bacterium]|nr:PIN domain-containing protein [Bacillota bacterium]
MIFIDSPALYALLDRDDRNHRAARAIWTHIVHGGEALLTHNYVLLEALALIQHRLGLEAVRALHEAILPLVTVVWVDEALHARAVAAWLASPREGESLVDRISVEVIRLRECRAIFTFDEAFAAEGIPLAG